MTHGLRAAVVGATGAVGQELLRLFRDRNFPLSSLRLMASSRSAGQVVEFDGKSIVIEDAEAADFHDLDVVFFSAGASRSKTLAPKAIEVGAVVIDNSSAYRMDPDVPLCVPEINPDSITPDTKLIANPNCTAMILLCAIAPLRQFGEFERVIVSTYQSVSGAGAAAMRELEEQTREVLAGQSPTKSIFPHQCAFNLFSHNTPINEHGFSDEEWKVIQESRKILGIPDLKMNVTCVRVPVMRAHSESVTVDFHGARPTIEQVRDALENAPGVHLIDDREANTFPMPITASGQDDVLVGRIRYDLSSDTSICLFVCGDQLLKGAALNAVQIAELMIEKGYLKTLQTA